MKEKSAKGIWMVTKWPSCLLLRRKWLNCVMMFALRRPIVAVQLFARTTMPARTFCMLLKLRFPRSSLQANADPFLHQSLRFLSSSVPRSPSALKSDTAAAAPASEVICNDEAIVKDSAFVSLVVRLFGNTKTEATAIRGLSPYVSYKPHTSHSTSNLTLSLPAYSPMHQLFVAQRRCRGFVSEAACGGLYSVSLCRQVLQRHGTAFVQRSH